MWHRNTNVGNCRGPTLRCGALARLKVLFAAVGNNSAANEINCAHTDNCMGEVAVQRWTGRDCVAGGLKIRAHVTYAIILICNCGNSNSSETVFSATSKKYLCNFFICVFF